MYHTLFDRLRQSFGNGLLTSLGVAAAIRFCPRLSFDGHLMVTVARTVVFYHAEDLGTQPNVT